jgi:hypothetical protein
MFALHDADIMSASAPLISTAPAMSPARLGA